MSTLPPLLVSGPCSLPRISATFDPLHYRWQAEGRRHSGILGTRQLRIGLRLQALERAARLLTPEIAANQLMKLAMFGTEEKGLTYIASLRPPSP